MEQKNILKQLYLSEKKNSLRIGTDAVLLAAYIKPAPRSRAVELGAGSGAVSLILAKNSSFSRIDAIEIQDELSEICAENIEKNGVSDLVFSHCSDVRNLSPIEFSGCKTVFANPPYMKVLCGKVSPHESREASRHEVLGGIKDFTRCASRILKTGGRFYTVYRPDRLETMFLSLKEFGFAPKRMTFVFSDATHSPSSVLCESVLGGGEGLKVTPPLFLRNPDGTDTEDATYIYSNAKLPDKFL